MTDEREKQNDTQDFSPGSVGDGGSNDSGIVASIQRSPTLFDLLDEKQKARVVTVLYYGSFVLGSSLSFLGFCWEHDAQIHRLPFEMRDWMITFIFVLLSLPAAGAVFTKRK